MDYGAFDRYKILADIAPNSSEYKKWKKIAEKTVTDPELIEQMEDIERRTNKMSGKHEFFDYKYINSNTRYEDAVVKRVLNDGKVELASGKQISLAGIKANEETKEYLETLLTPGDKITMRTYKDISFDEENNEALNEAVLYKDAENLNQQLIEMQGEEINDTDNSALALLGKQTGTQEVVGSILELVGHAPIPLIHSKLMRIESPLEAYKNEQIYGSSFQTWDHPIKNFIYPSFNKQSDKGLINESLSLGYAILHFSKISNKLASDDKALHFASSFVLSMLNPTAFVGGNTALLFNGLANKNVSKSFANATTSWQFGAKIGTAIGVAKYGYDNADNPLKAAGSFAIAGAAMAKNLSGIFEGLTTKKAAGIGALVGLGLSALKNPSFNKDMFSSRTIPDSTKEKWELDEYFDRLNYVKYMGLYKVASARAAFFEGSNIRDIFDKLDSNKKKIAKLELKERKIQEKQRNNPTYKQFKLEEIRQRKMALQENNNMFFKSSGKYTKAAIAYKKKAESTIYGLSQASSKDEILSAIPDQYRDYFQAFMNTSSKSERKKILKYVPEYLARPLKIAWGEKVDKPQSNARYFRSHKMPGMNWRGWKPNVNMKHVKMKTIENEGMIISDFGYYESEKSKASYDSAPAISNYKNSGILNRLNLITSLHGLGVNAYNVSVDETSHPGLWVVGDIAGNASDIKKAAGYEATKAIHGMLSAIF